MGVLLPKQPCNSWKNVGMGPIPREAQQRLSHTPFNGAAASSLVKATTIANGATRPLDEHMADGEVPINNGVSVTSCAMTPEMQDDIDVIPGTFGVAPCAPSLRLKSLAVNSSNCKSYMHRHEAVKSRNNNDRDGGSEGFGRYSSGPHFLPQEEHWKKCEKKVSKCSSGSDFIVKRIPSRFMSTVMAFAPMPERDFKSSSTDTEGGGGGQKEIREKVIGGGQRKKLSVRGSADSILMAASLDGDTKSRVHHRLSTLQLYRSARANTQRKCGFIEQWLTEVEKHRRERLRRVR
ncbi:hypothetical protein TraAM80_04314 [Trypanosoma rangeli]|uniref:Uncharacterized protein n=1 Tax=Trypanosoma rangeli TaxID=5698 RepID=A0A422NK35_TRYRA|nr:uncharacterized protein TraAM80_04314 [Trypanosoma rangeli]RNF05847.1 hypothetical protein TraAM80_04314 [Trypanosoma rangeli]|eukprot:RNF05847.1 hypothetical protein TraAM80_04314 [Trypanosoma rangeli]